MEFSSLQKDVQKLYIDNYYHPSGTYIPNPPISRELFLSAGWNINTYFSYCRLARTLYFAYMTYFEHTLRSVSDYSIDIDRKSKEKLEAPAKLLVEYALKDFRAFVEKYVGNTFDWTSIFSLPGSLSEVLFAGAYHPLVIHVPYKWYLAWIEREMGKQLARSSNLTQFEAFHKSREESLPVWYKLAYEDLERFHQSRKVKLDKLGQSLFYFDYAKPDNDNVQLITLLTQYQRLENEIDAIENRLYLLEEGFFDFKGDVLYIYKGETKCHREHHPIEAVTASVLGRRGNQAEININYCSCCHKYFLSESEFFHYRDLYGIVCALGIDRHSTGYAAFPLAEYSILRLYGYNVGKEDNLSDEERQNLLKILMDNAYVKKPEIIRYLELFLKMNHSRIEMTDSVSKWESDLNFVRNYQLDKQEKVSISEIKYAP